jgi:probable HAF family extracellular repeat protein
MTATVVAGAGVPAATGQPAYAGESVPQARRSIPARLIPITPSGLNNVGQVIGYGAVWQRGVVTDVDTLDGEPINTVDINDRGQIVGQSATASGRQHGFIWQRGVATDLGTLGGADSKALAINDRGEVVGVSNTANGPDAFFVWRRGVMTRLPVPGVVDIQYCFARINNGGQVAGNYLSDEPPPSGSGRPSRLFFWDRGVLSDLGDLGGDDVWVDGLNDRGQVVGSDYRQNGPPLVFFWDRGTRTDVGRLSIPPTTGSVDLNNRGQVVFTTPPVTTGPDRAQLWQRGVLTDLGDLGGPFPTTTAYAINERGEITGTLTGPSGGRAFVWRQGVLTQLDVLPGGRGSQALGINDPGLVIGISATEFDVQGVVWDTNRHAL